MHGPRQKHEGREEAKDTKQNTKKGTKKDAKKSSLPVRRGAGQPERDPPIFVILFLFLLRVLGVLRVLRALPSARAAWEWIQCDPWFVHAGEIL